MTPLASLLILAALATGATAQERIDTRTLTCAALQARVARDRTAILARNALAYEIVHGESGACRLDETGAPDFEPSADVPACWAGWRCKQRNSDGNPR